LITAAGERTSISGRSSIAFVRDLRLLEPLLVLPVFDFFPGYRDRNITRLFQQKKKISLLYPTIIERKRKQKGKSSFFLLQLQSI
jgi:hypothetical protein